MTPSVTTGAGARRVLAVRLDSMGDVLVTGPAIRAMARSASVTILVGPSGKPAASLLPGVDHIVEFSAPWITPDPEPVNRNAVLELVDRLSRTSFDAALVFTSFHQSPLPIALLLRLAGLPWIGAVSVDYPGSLLDLRHEDIGDVPESVRALSLTTAAEFLADGDGSRLAITDKLPDPTPHVGSEPYIVYHPGAAVPARMPSPEHSRTLVRSLCDAHNRVVVTGSADEADLVHFVADGRALTLAGKLDLAGLAAVLRRAEVLVAPNTGPAHLAAAVGTPVVSLFSPVVPPSRWAPHGVPSIVLGDQSSACKNTRARLCPLDEHKCLDSIVPQSVTQAVASLRTADVRDARSVRRTSMAGGPP